jgi:hypothetical protein
MRWGGEETGGRHLMRRGGEWPGAALRRGREETGGPRGGEGTRPAADAVGKGGARRSTRWETCTASRCEGMCGGEDKRRKRRLWAAYENAVLGWLFFAFVVGLSWLRIVAFGRIIWLILLII